MLVVDLNRLQREGRARVDADVPPDAGMWQDTDLRPREPVRVRLEAQQAGPDVVIHGTVSGSFDLECRRCLEPVVVELEEDVGLLYRAGGPADEGEEDAEDVHPLPERGFELDVSAPIREQVLVSVPRFVQCRDECAGLCPQCGTNLNESSCDCTTEEEDERWAPLRALKQDS